METTNVRLVTVKPNVYIELRFTTSPLFIYVIGLFTDDQSHFVVSYQPRKVTKCSSFK